MANESTSVFQKRGRPREFDGTPVSVRLPAGLHDALSVVAVRTGADLSDVIRRGLTQYVSQKAQSPLVRAK